MPAEQALSSPSNTFKEDNVIEWSATIFVMKFQSVTEWWNEEFKETQTDGTTDIGDSVNSILDFWVPQQ